jgi:hypothetical protein
MSFKGKIVGFFYLFLILALSFGAVPAQKKSQKKTQKKSQQKTLSGKPVMWEKVSIAQRDLFYGPGGTAMAPDLSRITFIKEEKGGHNKKFRIKDGSDRVWVAKPGREAQPETASVRLMWALGYKTEINYLVPSLTIPGKGTFKNVRLEARPENVERLGNWHWKSNPFMGTNEFQGLKIMMVLLHNWDVVDVNNTLLGVVGKNGNEVQYTVGDLGATFGRLGNNNFPVIYRFGRSVGKPNQYAKSILIRDVKNGRLELSYKGKLREMFKDITVSQGRWLADLLLQLKDRQIDDAFRAANYSQSDIAVYRKALKAKIEELDDATNQNLALK